MSIDLTHFFSQVYPLDMTRQMRDQRASMIQTPSQYRFVCEAVLKAWREGAVRPLPEMMGGQNSPAVGRGGQRRRSHRKAASPTSQATSSPSSSTSPVAAAS